MSKKPNDHGGGLDAAITQHGGERAQWVDLSTGINPVPYPISDIDDYFWTDLPDSAAQTALIDAARTFWKVPSDAAVLPSSGVSQLIAALPLLQPAQNIHIPQPTYNEHETAFRNAGWQLSDAANAKVIVHPNNPDGNLHDLTSQNVSDASLLIIDESFCDTCPEQTHVALSSRKNVIVLKGLGKFWGLAGLRLGFAIGHPDTIAHLRDLIGPWAVSGPAQIIGKRALSDLDWAKQTRQRLKKDAAQLDKLCESADLISVGGTDLFRLYECENAGLLKAELAKNYIHSRIFPYSSRWIRLGLPGSETQWKRLKAALRV